MAIKFYNLRSGETLVADSEPKIAALWGTSDRSPNASEGQDFGWRLAPEVVVEMKRIRSDHNAMIKIASIMNKSLDMVRETDILKYISDKTSFDEAPVAQDGDYEDEYRNMIADLEKKTSKASLPKKNNGDRMESSKDKEVDQEKSK